MTDITRLADTNAQEQSLRKVERVAKKLKFNIRAGTKIGKYPQTVILDHHYQDSLIYVNSNGKIKINDVEVTSSHDIKKVIEDIKPK